MKQYRLLSYTNNYKLSAILTLFLKKSNNLQKINDSFGYEMQCFFTSSNFPKCHSRENGTCQVHQDMKPTRGGGYFGLRSYGDVPTFRVDFLTQNILDRVQI